VRWCPSPAVLALSSFCFVYFFCLGYGAFVSGSCRPGSVVMFVPGLRAQGTEESSSSFFLCATHVHPRSHTCRRMRTHTCTHARAHTHEHARAQSNAQVDSVSLLHPSLSASVVGRGKE
jgi:hypothetical protein